MSRAVLVAIALTACCSALADDEPEPAQDADQASKTTKVVMLGTGTPNADPDRFGPATAIIVNGTPYIVDCGPGIVRRAAAARRAGAASLAARNLDKVFITHLHSDHTLGYPDLIFSPWVLGRKVPLEAYGPPGLATMTDHIQKAYAQDTHLRLDGFEPANPDGYKVNVHEVGPGLIYKDDNVSVTAFPVKHGSWEHAYGFKFETADHTIVISGDTRGVEELVRQAAGCDVLIHEVYSQAGYETRKPVWKKYHASFHTSSRELAEIAVKAKPKLLVLYHQLLWGTTEEALLAEIAAIYDGKVVSGKDLDIFELDELK